MSYGRKMKIFTAMLLALLLVACAQSHSKNGSGREYCPLISYIFDDGYASHYDVVATMADELDISVGFAITTYVLGREGRVDAGQLLQLQSRGHEIINHSETHKDLRAPGVDQLVAGRDIEQGLAGLEALGLEIGTFVAPHSQTHGDYMSEVRRLHDLAYTSAREDVVWHAEDDLFSLPRLSSDGISLTDIQSAIDLAIKSNGFLTLYHHDVEAGSADEEKVRSVIEYALESGAIFATPRDMARFASGEINCPSI